MFDETDFGPDYGTDLESWCGEIDAIGDGKLFERLKFTGITKQRCHFNIYLRRRPPDNSLEKVRTWNDELPDIR